MIFVPNPQTRGVQVKVKKVLLDDGCVLEEGDIAFVAPHPTLLIRHLHDEAVVEEYRRRTTPSAQYVPCEMDSYWLCTCGALNALNVENCSSCECTKRLVNEALDAEELVQCARVQRQKTEEEKTRKKGVIISVGTIAALALLIVTLIVTAPHRYYKKACTAFEQGKYETAGDIFGDLGDFKDSPQRREECSRYTRYGMAKSTMEEGSYREAMDTFCELGDFEDAEELAVDCFLSLVERSLDEGYEIDYIEDYDLNFRSSHYDKIYEMVWECIEEHTQYEYWIEDGSRPKGVLNVLKLLPVDYERVEDLTELFDEMTGAGGIYFAYARTSQDFLISMWDIEFVRDYALEDSHVTYFLESHWETASGDHFIEFSEAEDWGNTTCRHTLPYDTSVDAHHYDIVDQHYVLEDEDGNELTKVFRFRFIDANTISVYCFSNGRTYTMYREDN